MARWKARVFGRVVPKSLPPPELVDHLPRFLDEVIDALDVASCGDPDASSADTRTAAGHGEQRLRLGFSVDAVVREYGILREVIEDLVHEHGHTLSPAQLRCLGQTFTTGVAAAVSEYARQRDAELARQHNEHLGFIAHELRNPLSTASLALDILTQGGHLPVALRPSRALSRSIEQMQSLVDHALELARGSSGVDLRREPTTLRHLLEETEQLAGADAFALGVTLSVTVTRDGEVFVDQRLVRSALSNLVRNALKYSHRGGSVEVRGRVEADCAIFEIEDSCGGIEPSKVELAFAPFVRLENGKPGFGLGLAIAKQAADAHAGTIRVQNLPGKGCIFVLELPITDARSGSCVA
jgi:signal transduction histidine kinase